MTILPFGQTAKGNWCVSSGIIYNRGPLLLLDMQRPDFEGDNTWKAGVLKVAPFEGAGRWIASNVVCWLSGASGHILTAFSGSDQLSFRCDFAIRRFSD